MLEMLTISADFDNEEHETFYKIINVFNVL